MRDWLTHRVRSTPDASALIEADGGQTWTYADLDAAVATFAGRLSALGIERGDHVGLVLSARVETVVALHAAARLGACAVPLNTRLTASELAPQIDRSDVTIVLCELDTEELARAAAGDVPLVSVDEPQWEGVAGLSAVDPDAVTPARWSINDPQLILFTSGSTGEPKAVALSMGNLLASAVSSAFRLGVDPDDRWLVTLSLYHMGGIAPLFRSALYGTTVVLRSAFSPGEAADDLGRYDITLVSLVPTMLQAMLERRGTLSESLRIVLLGGAPTPVDLLERCRNYSIPVSPTYGMTETASQIATATPTEAVAHLGTVGRPLLWADITVLGEDGAPVEAGEVGEFVVGGPMVALGYYDDPAANESAFCEYGFRTGDVGYRTEAGRVYVLNRKDDRIITGGENVDPGEVTSALRAHPSVEAVAVLGLPDETWGERVAALVVPADDDLSAAELVSFCRKRIAGYKLPRTIAFVDDLPRTVSGTIDRPAARERLTEAVESGVAAEIDPNSPANAPEPDADSPAETPEE
ncbi:o-succinylbenzoate--CoA ligase [Haloferacaceae archaeon DSL9]